MYDCPLIELSGPPHARGVSYGQQASGRIRQGIAFYSGQVGAAGLDTAARHRLVHDYLPVIEAFEPLYITEMQGIAQGAAVAFEDVVLLNARTEILKLAQRPDLRDQLAQAAEADGCTGLFVLPGAARDGALIHAQNWDWRAQCAETSVVLRIRNEDGPDMLAFTEAGGLARSGLNSAGVAITANYLESDRDYRQVGVPLALIRRKVLEQEHVALAMRAVYATAKSASNNMMVTHASGLGIDFECAPDETFLVHADHGLLVHANHWQSAVALGKLRDTGIANTPDSLYRDMRVRALLQAQPGAQPGGITVEQVKAALFDDGHAPWSVCRPVRPGVGGGTTATVAMIVMQPGAGVMEVCMMPATQRRFVRFDLNERAARAAAE